MAKLQRLKELRAERDELDARKSASVLEPYEAAPAKFVTDLVDADPTDYQLEILERIPVERRVSLRGPHGLGKTALKAWVVLWFALTRDGRDWKIPTTASAWYQLEHYLWPEIHKWSRRLRWDAIGRPPFTGNELLMLSLKLRTGEAFAIASNDPARMEGAHADHLLYVFDEAKTIPAETFDAAEGAFSGAGADTDVEAFALMSSTPGEPNGRFFEVQSRRAGTEDWWVRHVRRDEVMAAGRMSQDWQQARARHWGATSAVYLNRVEGEFASSEADTVIPLPWIEAAIDRWKTAHPEWRADADGRPDPRFFDLPGRLDALGVDVARSGEDRTVLAPRSADTVGPLRYTHLEPTDVTTGRVQALLDATDAPKSTPAIVDVIGVGAGVFDQLHGAGYRAVAFNAAEGTTRKDRSGELGFLNCRAAAWWLLRDALDPAFGSTVELPPDDEMIGDLTAPHWRVVGKGLIQVESKDDIRKRLGRSTDAADAVIQAFWPAPRSQTSRPHATGGAIPRAGQVGGWAGRRATAGRFR